MSVNFADLGIEQQLVETLNNMNIVTPTPVKKNRFHTYWKAKIF